MGERRSADRIFARRSGTRMAFTVVALLAMVLQAFVVQTHIHTTGIFSPGYERVTDAVSPSHVEHVGMQGEHPQGCVICQALAANGNITLAAAAAIADATNASYETAALQIRRAPLAITHSWRSRAPPLAA